MPNVPYPKEVIGKLVTGNGSFNTNKFLSKPFLIAKFDCKMIAMPLNEMIPARPRQRTLPDFQAFKELTAKIEMGIIAWSVGSQNQGVVRYHLLAKVCTLLLCCRLLHTCRQADRQK